MLEFSVMKLCRYFMRILQLALTAAALLTIVFFNLSFSQDSPAEGEIEEEIATNDVVVELPELAPDSAPRGYYSGGIPLILVLPFKASAPNAEMQTALSYGIAARLVDDFYPISAARTVPLDRLVSLFPEFLATPPLKSDKDSISAVFAAISASYAISGTAELKGSLVTVSATLHSPEGSIAAEISSSGELEMLPAILSKISFDVLTVAKAALTDSDRRYLEYVEPYSIDVWLKCQFGLSVAAGMTSGSKTDKKKIEAARKSLADALKAAPQYLRAREALGVIEYTSGNLKAAESAFRELVTRNPQYGPARFYLGAILLKNGNFNAARKELTLATEINKNDALSWLFLGKAHLAAGQPMMAEQAFRRSLDIDPSNPDAFFALGMTLLEQGSNSLAAEAFGEVVLRRPELAEAHYNLALALFRSNDLKLASRHFRNYIELTPNDEYGDHSEVGFWLIEIDEELKMGLVTGTAVEVEN